MKFETREVENTIKEVSDEYNLCLQQEDITSMAVAYIRRGDINLAVNSNYEVLSDLMEGEEMDLISENLDRTYGRQIKHIPLQTIPVIISSQKYDTYLDHYGEQRFVGNRIIQQVAKHLEESPQNENSSDTLNLSSVHRKYEAGEFSLEEMVQLYVSLGVTLKQFRTTPIFASLSIMNPYMNRN